LPRTANVKANKKTRIATMIVNATRSRTQSPLQTLGAQTFYTMLEEPFYGGSPLLLSVMYNVATCSSLIR
jgi:hypothetical protein